MTFVDPVTSSIVEQLKGRLALQTEFYEYVKQTYSGSTRPLNHEHLVKGCRLEFGLKLVLEKLRHRYLAAQHVGQGEDFTVVIGVLFIPIECKNEAKHIVTPQSVRSKVISRFKAYTRNQPKILLRTPANYTGKAVTELIDNNVQVITISQDINSFQDLMMMLPEIEEKIERALYKFRYYTRYQVKSREDAPRPNLMKQGVAVGFLTGAENMCQYKVCAGDVVLWHGWRWRNDESG